MRGEESHGHGRSSARDSSRGSQKHASLRAEAAEARLLGRLRARTPNAAQVGQDLRIVARLSSRALRGNFEAIQRQVPEASLLPMLKANAYGHGAAWVAGELAEYPEVYGFGVATFDEALELRKALGARLYRNTRILVFSGAAPWSEAKGQLCERHRLTPVIATDADWIAFYKAGWPGKLGYELKFNTGMNRLGLSLQSAALVAKALRDRTSDWHPDGILSHLAMAESPECKLTRNQRDRFCWLRGGLSGAFPAARFHLANSAGIWNSKQLGLKDLTDAVRPGLSLYGVAPWSGAPPRGLRPVMTLEVQVIQIHRLRMGESVGYGARYTVDASQRSNVAILAAGYADGLHRTLGAGSQDHPAGQGKVWIHGQLQEFAGAISMDLAAVRCPEGTKRGEWARILGPEIDPWAQAASARSIPYELLTSVSERVQRVYE